jgi:S1-C subfamily serine protease
LRTSDGEEVLKEVVLRSAEGETALKTKAEMSKTSALGAVFSELTAKEKKELAIQSGVKVKAIEPGKLRSAGVNEGDIITVINQKPCTSVEQLTDFLNAAKGGVYLEIMTPSGKKTYIAFGI